MAGKRVGKPKAFATREELIDKYMEFMAAIAEGYDGIPSKTAFCRWMGEQHRELDRKTIYNTINKYFPDMKRIIDEMSAETMVEGGMKGKYTPAMTIFALKNWFGYKDKIETEHSGGLDIGTSKLDSILGQLKDG